MAYTMQDIRDEVYKLLDEYSNSTASIDSNLSARIDEQINMAYYELAKKDKVSGLVEIPQFPVENMLGETFKYDTHTTTAINYSCQSAYAYYFEVNGECSVDIKEGSSLSTMTTLSTLTITSISTFTRYRDFMTGTTSGDYYQLSFYGDNVYTIKNVAFYPYTFGNSTASIPDFKPYMEYSLPSDYMDRKTVSYRYKSDYGTFTDYKIEGSYLMIPRGYSAEFFFYYWKQVTGVATATDTFDIKDENALIIPYYVAGMIMIGNGFNVAAGNKLVEMYEYKKDNIDTSQNYGKHDIYNICGW